jgi:nucleotidyltransferase substrate binding protein (TIGR01987 family)
MTKSNSIDFSSLQLAMKSLQEAIHVDQSDNSNTFVKDASIQRFKYTYELCHKMLKRYLESTEPSSAEIDSMTFQTLIRTGAEKGLLKNSWDKWSEFRNARNLTTHTYNEKMALEVCAILPAFLVEAEYLYAQLTQRSG